MEILAVFLMKTIDNALSTAKTIFINKEKYMTGAILNGLSTFFYLIAIVQITKSNSLLSIISMCIATILGTYLPGFILKKSERDKLFIFDITADDFENGKVFADAVRNTNIAIKSYITYDDDLNKVLSCKIYCINKNESTIINNLIPKTFRYNVYVPLEL